jgi:hypothetical protein
MQEAFLVRFFLLFLLCPKVDTIAWAVTEYQRFAPSVSCNTLTRHQPIEDRLEEEALAHPNGGAFNLSSSNYFVDLQSVKILWFRQRLFS